MEDWKAYELFLATALYSPSVMDSFPRVDMVATLLYQGVLSVRKRMSFYIRRDNNASDYPAKTTHHIGINEVCAGLGVMLGTWGRV